MDQPSKVAVDDVPVEEYSPLTEAALAQHDAYGKLPAPVPNYADKSSSGGSLNLSMIKNGEMRSKASSGGKLNISAALAADQVRPKSAGSVAPLRRQGTFVQAKGGATQEVNLDEQKILQRKSSGSLSSAEETLKELKNVKEKKVNETPLVEKVVEVEEPVDILVIERKVARKKDPPVMKRQGTFVQKKGGGSGELKLVRVGSMSETESQAVTKELEEQDHKVSSEVLHEVHEAPEPTPMPPAGPKPLTRKPPKFERQNTFSQEKGGGTLKHQLSSSSITTKPTASLSGSSDDEDVREDEEEDDDDDGDMTQAEVPRAKSRPKLVRQNTFSQDKGGATITRRLSLKDGDDTASSVKEALLPSSEMDEADSDEENEMDEVAPPQKLIKKAAPTFTRQNTFTQGKGGAAIVRQLSTGSSTSLPKKSSLVPSEETAEYMDEEREDENSDDDDHVENVSQAPEPIAEQDEDNDDEYQEEEFETPPTKVAEVEEHNAEVVKVADEVVKVSDGVAAIHEVVKVNGAAATHAVVKVDGATAIHKVVKVVDGGAAIDEVAKVADGAAALHEVVKVADGATALREVVKVADSATALHEEVKVADGSTALLEVVEVEENKVPKMVDPSQTRSRTVVEEKQLVMTDHYQSPLPSADQEKMEVVKVADESPSPMTTVEVREVIKVADESPSPMTTVEVKEVMKVANESPSPMTTVEVKEAMKVADESLSPMTTVEVKEVKKVADESPSPMTTVEVKEVMKVAEESPSPMATVEVKEAKVTDEAPSPTTTVEMKEAVKVAAESPAPSVIPEHVQTEENDLMMRISDVLPTPLFVPDHVELEQEKGKGAMKMTTANRKGTYIQSASGGHGSITVMAEPHLLVESSPLSPMEESAKERADSGTSTGSSMSNTIYEGGEEENNVGNDTFEMNRKGTFMQSASGGHDAVVVGNIPMLHDSQALESLAEEDGDEDVKGTSSAGSSRKGTFIQNSLGGIQAHMTASETTLLHSTTLLTDVRECEIEEDESEQEINRLGSLTEINLDADRRPSSDIDEHESTDPVASLPAESEAELMTAIVTPNTAKTRIPMNRKGTFLQTQSGGTAIVMTSKVVAFEQTTVGTDRIVEMNEDVIVDSPPKSLVEDVAKVLPEIKARVHGKAKGPKAPNHNRKETFTANPMGKMVAVDLRSQKDTPISKRGIGGLMNVAEEERTAKAPAKEVMMPKKPFAQHHTRTTTFMQSSENGAMRQISLGAEPDVMEEKEVVLLPKEPVPLNVKPVARHHSRTTTFMQNSENGAMHQITLGSEKAGSLGAADKSPSEENDDVHLPSAETMRWDTDAADKASSPCEKGRQRLSFHAGVPERAERSPIQRQNTGLAKDVLSDDDGKRRERRSTITAVGKMMMMTELPAVAPSAPIQKMFEAADESAKRRARALRKLEKKERREMAKTRTGKSSSMTGREPNKKANPSIDMKEQLSRPTNAERFVETFNVYSAGTRPTIIAPKSSPPSSRRHTSH